MSTANKIIFRSQYVRKFPDPLNKLVSGDKFDIEHFVMLVKAKDLPSGVSKEPNPRNQAIDWGIYKKVKESLLNQDDPSFHLKNKGITILAHSASLSEDKTILTVLFGDNHGIVDGGHTYEIVLSTIETGECPEEQYVRVEVVTGVPADLVTEIAGGLNTAVQVEKASLANLDKAFDWIKDTVKGSPYEHKIAYKENEENMECDIRDVIAMITPFNHEMFPDNSKQPKEAYVSKSKCLDQFLAEDKKASFKKIQPILKDILELHDYIQLKARLFYNASKLSAGERGRGASMKGVFETKKRGKYQLPFLGEETDTRLYEATCMPMLAAMRVLVELTPDGKGYRWRVANFERVKEIFERVAAEMVDITYRTSLVYNRKPNAVGKDDNLWSNLYKTVAISYLESGSK